MSLNANESKAMGPQMGGTNRHLKVHWIVEGVSGSFEEGYSSTLASNRYRAILPAQALSSAGHQISLVDARRWRWESTSAPDVIVVGKLLPSGDEAEFRGLSQHVLSQVAAALRAGVPVVADFNDDHFDHPLLGPHWRELASSVTACTAGSEAMADAVARRTGVAVHVVGDPIASPRGEPRVFRKQGGLSRLVSAALSRRGTQRLKLVWYGNPGNWPAMQRWGNAIASLAEEQPLLLWIVTQPLAPIAAWVDEFNRRNAPAAIAELAQWDEETQWGMVRDADAVLIPSEPSDPRKAVKSSNRLVDALHAGRYVVASPLPAYLPYADFVGLTDAPVPALRWLMDHPEDAHRKVVQGQAAVIANAGLEAVAATWSQVLTSASADLQPAAVRLEPPKAPTDGTPGSPVRLNLGCGDKILPGYVNVDVVESRAGKRPDVICDLHRLTPFADDSTDEVMAIHVVEHFWRWEVEDILREWVRVLKPGGRMVLECPNLTSACEEFLKDPDRASRPTKEGQRTMWVFYGDPSWRDPYMIHRWGYTPASLGLLLENVGLVKVRQEPAQYKLREPRDMRVVGEKPLPPE